MPMMNIKKDTKIWYDLVGEGPLIVLNHGYGSSHLSLSYVANFLKTDFKCLLWDQRGQGNSTKQLRSDYEETRKIYTLQRIAEDCFNLIRGLGLLDENPGGIYMYGHSMGGMISQLYAIEHELTLKGLALGSTTAVPIKHEYAMLLEQLKQGKIHLNEDFFAANAENGFTSAFVLKHPEYVEEVVADKIKVPEDVTIALLDNFLNNYQTSRNLVDLRSPVIIIKEKKDESIPFKCGKHLHNIIPNNRLIAFQEQKHEINKEIPEKVAHEIRSFFFNESSNK